MGDVLVDRWMVLPASKGESRPRPPPCSLWANRPKAGGRGGASRAGSPGGREGTGWEGREEEGSRLCMVAVSSELKSLGVKFVWISTVAAWGAWQLQDSELNEGLHPSRMT